MKTDYVVPRDVQPWMTKEIMYTRRECVKERGAGLEKISVRGSSSDVHCIMFDFENIIHGEKKQFKKTDFGLWC